MSCIPLTTASDEAADEGTRDVHASPVVDAPANEDAVIASSSNMLAGRGLRLYGSRVDHQQRLGEEAHVDAAPEGDLLGR